jgi:hypothetical protein
MTKRGLAGAEPTRKPSVAVMTSEAQAFTAVELERMLDWYRRLPLCHNVVPRDDELADKIALQIAQPRANPAGRPSP